jgi:hypothetical protein
VRFFGNYRKRTKLVMNGWINSFTDESMESLLKQIFSTKEKHSKTDK